MQWHKGDVSDAVNKVDNRNKYLVVFLRDDDVSSSLYTEIFESSKGLHLILNNSVCLNLLKGGTEYQQFSEVYKATVVPSIYIITYLGKVADIITGDIDEEKLIDRFQKIIDADVKDIELDTTCASSSNASGETESVDLNEKMIEIRQKLAEKHRQRKEEEKAKEIADELNRRELGKKLVELKKSQKEIEENEIKEEIRRNRQDDKDARNKVLRQIEEDKAERRKKFANQTIVPSVAVNEPTIETEVRQRTDGKYTSTRLQFRFPDGSSKMSIFTCDSKFSAVREFVAAHIRDNMNSKKFEIKQFFPKKTLAAADDSLTLSELLLVPSASLAVVFLDQKSPSTQVAAAVPGLLQAPIHYIYLVAVAIFRWLRAQFWAPSEVARPPAAPPAPATVQASHFDWEERQRRLLAVESRTIKKDGNLAQFSDAEKQKKDEDDATWNGNSTQQM